MPSDRSCYVLELSIMPGGARRGSLMVYNRFAHLRSLLERELLDPPHAEKNAALMRYGQTMMIWAVVRGELSEGIDLWEHVQVHDAHGVFQPASALIDRETMEDDTLLEPPFHVDFEALERRLPPLPEPLLRPGERMPLSADPDLLEAAWSHLHDRDELRYGFYDTEYGAPDRSWPDPDPP